MRELGGLGILHRTATNLHTTNRAELRRYLMVGSFGNCPEGAGVRGDRWLLQFFLFLLFLSSVV